MDDTGQGEDERKEDAAFQRKRDKRRKQTKLGRKNGASVIHIWKERKMR